MTHPAITAAITAARDFAEALEKTQAAFATSAAPLIVGQEIDADTVYGLPLGSEFTDRDGDRYAVAEQGLVWANDGSDRTSEVGLDPADYQPLVLTRLPEPDEEPTPPAIKVGDKVRITALSWLGADHIGAIGTVRAERSFGDLVVEIPSAPGDRVYDPADLELVTEPEPYAPKDGDRVKILGLSIFDADYIGQIGTVVDANYGPGQVIVTPDGDARARRIFKVADLERAPEPAPTRVEIRTADDRERLVAAEPGIHGEGSAYISVSSYGERGAAWLSRDEARQLAATLTAIADS